MTKDHGFNSSEYFKQFDGSIKNLIDQIQKSNLQLCRCLDVVDPSSASLVIKNSVNNIVNSEASKALLRLAIANIKSRQKRSESLIEAERTLNLHVDQINLSLAEVKKTKTNISISDVLEQSLLLREQMLGMVENCREQVEQSPKEMNQGIEDDLEE